MRRHLPRVIAVCLALGAALAGCTSGTTSGTASGTASGTGQAQGRAAPSRWTKFRHVPGVVDLAGPRADGSFTVAANGRLLTLSRAGTLTPFAQGPDGYLSTVGSEPYITLAGSSRVAGAGCSFSSGTIFALEPRIHPGVIEIGANGRARRFLTFPTTWFPDGIAFDSTGHFGHRLLVTAKVSGQTTVLAVDCAGGTRTITTHAPRSEGGIAVAPASFGRYGGDLITTDELTGQIFFISPNGSATELTASGLPHGPDIGVESAGFVPPGFGPGDAAYLADRFTAHNKHPGTDSILRLAGQALIKAGVRPGDLLVATEGSARTIVVRCPSYCAVRYVTTGPVVTHAEGHIVFTRAGG